MYFQTHFHLLLKYSRFANSIFGKAMKGSVKAFAKSGIFRFDFVQKTKICCFCQFFSNGAIGEGVNYMVIVIVCELVLIVYFHARHLSFFWKM